MAGGWKGVVGAAAAVVGVSGLVAMEAQQTPQAPEIWLVNLTASWGPNCRVLDPRIEAAAAEFPAGAIGRTVLDFSTEDSHAAAFNAINGTLLAGVYADHVGVTALGVIVAADTGEKLACVNRTMTVREISARLSAARSQVRREGPNARRLDDRLCPASNKTVRIGG